MNFYILLKNATILRRDDLFFIHCYNLAQRLQYCFIGSKYENIMAKAVIFRILICKQKLVEDTGRHKDSLTKSHRQRIYVIRINGRILSHGGKDIFVVDCRHIIESHLPLCAFIHHINRIVGKIAFSIIPPIE